MTPRHELVIVDGSNLATEGRTLPSLRQLEEAVQAFSEEFSSAEIVVVVDASFEHRLPAAERERFKQAESAGEVVMPPAGSIGRGDAFILKAAKRANATVLSNDSFQEFQGEHPWLFEEGRLIGGKPVSKVGWIFTPRNPVRATRAKRASAATATAAKRSAAPAATATKRSAAAAPVVPVTAAVGPARPAAKRAAKPAPAAKAAKPPAVVKAAGAGRAQRASKASAPAPAAATGATVRAERRPPKESAASAAKSTAKSASGRSVRAKRVEPPAPAPGRKVPGRPAAARPAAPRGAATSPAKRTPEPVNTLRSFRRLAADYPVGKKLAGEVVQFTSHGAMIAVRVGRTMQVICYAPLAGLGTPPPTRARDVLRLGETHEFTVVAFDETRRRAELALRR